MSLCHVRIHPNLKASEAEDLINGYISANPDYEISYEMMIETSVTFGDMTESKYSLLVNFEQERIPE